MLRRAIAKPRPSRPAPGPPTASALPRRGARPSTTKKNGRVARDVHHSTRSGFFVGSNRHLQVPVLDAGDQADVLQRCEVVFSFGEITLYQIGLAEVFMCAAVTRIERNRLPVMHE